MFLRGNVTELKITEVERHEENQNKYIAKIIEYSILYS